MRLFALLVVLATPVVLAACRDSGTEGNDQSLAEVQPAAVQDDTPEPADTASPAEPLPDHPHQADRVSDAGSTLFPNAVMLEMPSMDGYHGYQHNCRCHFYRPEVFDQDENNVPAKEYLSLADLQLADQEEVIYIDPLLEIHSSREWENRFTVVCWKEWHLDPNIGGKPFPKLSYDSWISVFDENGQLVGRTDSLDRVERMVEWRPSSSDQMTILLVQEFLGDQYFFNIEADGSLELELEVGMGRENSFNFLACGSAVPGGEFGEECFSIILPAGGSVSTVNHQGNFIYLHDCRMPDGRSAADVDTGYFIIRFGNDRVFPFSYVEDFDLSRFWSVRDEIPADSGLIIAGNVGGD